MDSNRGDRESLLLFILFFLKGVILPIKESVFQADLICDLADLFQGCVVIKNDPNYIQGIPDLVVLFNNQWACLECKKSLKEPYRPNQEYYLEILDNMSFAAMICPENKDEVLYELQRAFAPRRATRISKR
jgi:hypothetical protein